MRNIKVKAYKSSAKLKKEDQLAWKIAEISSDNAPLNEKAIDQILIYNKFLKSSYLMITNGINHLFLKNLNEKVDVINHLPVYLDL